MTEHHHQELIRKISRLLSEVRSLRAELTARPAARPNAGELLVPEYDESGNWINASEAAALEGLARSSLRRYRQLGLRSPCGTYGLDTGGRMWRRRPGSTPHSWPLYFKPSLIRQKMPRDDDRE